MDAERYIREKESLSREFNGEDRLNSAVTDIIGVLKKYNADLTPGKAFDLFCFVLETQHLSKFDISDRMKKEIACSRSTGS